MGPNIAKKGGPLRKMAWGDRQTHFGTFNFWRVRALRPKTRNLLNFSGLVSRYCGLLGYKTYWQEGWHWPAARKLRNSGIQKVETLIFLSLDPNLSILDKSGCNSSFTRPGGHLQIPAGPGDVPADPGDVVHPV